ncbi:uncharacterized protein [Aquarana catesbeiana]|uniref:uncharacterized protein isoform X1 n=1 Tax=Aquarana catesbeiana TaxID=8400 RepID=UPI003CC995EC
MVAMTAQTTFTSRGQGTPGMGCNIPSSAVIPAVAARLKYYVDVERKEVGFDLSLHPKDTNEKYRLYEVSNHMVHQSQGIKNHFLDKQMEAALRHYIGKSEADKKDEMEVKQERRIKVQRKIKKNMSALTMPDRFSNNCVYPSSLNQKLCDLEGLSSDLIYNHPPDISHGEFKRLVALAADLIVATTPGCPLPHLHQHKEDGAKAGKGQYFTSTCVKIPTCKQEPSTLNKESHTQYVENVDYGSTKFHPIEKGSSKVTEKSKNIDYEIIVHIGVISPKGAKPPLFMSLIGDHGKSKTLFLQNTLYSSATSSTGQVVSSYVKAKDVGELKKIMLGVDEKEQDCRCYCINISILKGKTKYVFPCNKWLSRQIVMIYVGECDSLDSNSQAGLKDTENHQTRKTCRLSADSSNVLYSNNNPFLITSKMADLNSCKSTGKVESSKLEDIVYKINSTETEVSKKIEATKINSFQTINTNSSESSKRYKNKASKRIMAKRHASSEVKLQNVPCSKETTVIRNQSGRDQKESDQIPILEDKHFNTTTEDSVPEPVIANNITDMITKGRKNTYEDLQEHKSIQTNGPPTVEHRRASSPVGYVFFSHERQGPAVLDEVNINARRNTGSSINPNSLAENTEPAQSIRERAEGSSADNNDNDKEGASQLYLLQQILLKSEGDWTDSPPGANSQPSIANLVNLEKTESEHDKSDQGHEAHSVHAQDGGCDCPDTESVQNPSCLCSCEDCCSNESDSTLNEEYLFSDNSLVLSPSEDEECEIYSKSIYLDKDTNELPQQMLQNTNNYRIHKERRVHSRNENANIFQRSLAAIHSSDISSLKNLCSFHFFLPSIKDKEGKTLLHHAASQENPHISQVLLDTTVGMLNIDQQDIFNKTALHYAVENGNAKMITLLLDRGARVEITDKGSTSKTVLDIALRKIQMN